jgi:serine dehydrogenase proteinase
MAKKITRAAAVPSPSPFSVLADKIAKSLDADLLFYNAPIERHLDQRVIELCNSMRRRTNVALFLVTSGGDADAAYRIATCLQTKYKKFLLFVPGFCKSAGTLVALGAHQIIISDQGENGPLDVQMQRKDELVGSESGLTSTTALRTLNEQAYSAFEYFLLKITQGAGPSISTKTITEIAVKLACGTFSHIYQQIDPMHVAEAERALQVAKAYGYRLAGRSQNLISDPNDALEHLISH